MPDDHWDSAAGKIKDEAKFGEWVSGNAAAAAADASRRAQIPAPDAYKLGTSQNFKPPEGLAFKIDDKDPLWSQARAWAHKNGLSQEAFAEAVDLVAGRDIGTAQSVKASFDGEVAKLGASGPARVDAALQWMNAMGGPKAAGLTKILKIAPLAETIEAVEALMSRFTSQGVTPFSQAHRTTPADNKIPGYEKMSFEQRRLAQEQNKLRAQSGTGR